MARLSTTAPNRLLPNTDGTVNHEDRPFSFGDPFNRPWYHIFPTFDYGPSGDMYVEEVPQGFDPTIRSQMSDGSDRTRARFSTVPREFTIVLENLTQANRATLDNFQRNEVNFGASRFKWTDTTLATFVVYNVKFSTTIRFTPYRNDSRLPLNRWKAEFKLKTV